MSSAPSILLLPLSPLLNVTRSLRSWLIWLLVVFLAVFPDRRCPDWTCQTDFANSRRFHPNRQDKRYKGIIDVFPSYPLNRSRIPALAREHGQHYPLLPDASPLTLPSRTSTRRSSSVTIRRLILEILCREFGVGRGCWCHFLAFVYLLDFARTRLAADVGRQDYSSIHWLG